jgi:sulfocyanin
MMSVLRNVALITAMAAGAVTASAQGGYGPGAAKPAKPNPPAQNIAVNKDNKASEANKDEFMSFDAASKSVKLQMIAALGSANGGMNFNGGAKGNQTITVPEGWTVNMHFVNKDAIPHSAIVIEKQEPLPVIPQDPAIPRAYTSHVTDGLPTDGTDDTSFKASKAGNYVIVCGVPGHGPSGMWINFVVSADAKEPSYTK